MDKLVLILTIIIFVILYRFVCDCILRKKEKFLNSKGYELNRTNIEDLQHGGHFSKVKNDNIVNTPLYAINHEQKNRVRGLVKPILKKINKQLKLKFELLHIEHITQKVENNGNVRLKLDIFVLEKLNHYNRRLLLDLTLDYQINQIIVNQIMLANAKNIKDNSKHQDHYFNQTILSQDNMNPDSTIYGHSDSQLAFDKLDYQNEYTNQKNFKEWILPKAYLEKINGSLPVWPCRVEEFAWDTYGISKTKVETKNCQGINSSYEKKQYQPKFNPVHKQVNKEGKYNWIHGYSVKGEGGKGFDLV